jgi:hypothetical protein
MGTGCGERTERKLRIADGTGACGAIAAGRRLLVAALSTPEQPATHAKATRKQASRGDHRHGVVVKGLDRRRP